MGVKRYDLFVLGVSYALIATCGGPNYVCRLWVGSNLIVSGGSRMYLVVGSLALFQ